PQPVPSPLVRRRAPPADPSAAGDACLVAGPAPHAAFVAIVDADADPRRPGESLLEPRVELGRALRRERRIPRDAERLIEFGELLIDAGGSTQAGPRRHPPFRLHPG